MRRDLAKYIDHTLLRADANIEDIRELCAEAKCYSFYAVCVNSVNVKVCAEALEGSEVLIASTIAFPLGAMSRQAKIAEAKQAVIDGAHELDMVVPLGALCADDDDAVRDDIRAVVEAAEGRVVKVILETALLRDDQKKRGAELAVIAGADFVKTSTGFKDGASEQDVRILRDVVGTDLGVKASGGIRDADTVDRILQAGANRIGTSSGIKIVCA